MALKHESTTEFNGTAQFNGKLIVSDTLWDTSNSQGTTGQVLSKDGSNNVVWATPSGGGGSLTGSGVANRAAFWDGTSSLNYDNDFTWDNTNKRLGLNTTSPSYVLDVQGDVQFGSAGLRYDSVNKRTGCNIATPQESLHVGGNLRIQTGGIKDGSNSIGSAGDVLTSTGTQVSWQAPSAVAFRDTKIFYDSWKVGTTGTTFLDATGGGSQASLGLTNLIAIPYDGKLTSLTVITNGTQTGFTFYLVNYLGTALWTSSSTSLTANTATTFTPNTTITKSSHRMVGLKMNRATSSSSNYAITMTATFEWDV